ncbi:MAG: LCP family protein [Pseudonocardiales bacterium]
MSEVSHSGRHATNGRGTRLGAVSARALVALLSATVLFATGVGWVTVGSLERNLTSTDVLSSSDPDGSDSDGATDILLVGNDSRTDAAGNLLPAEVLATLRTEQAEGTNTDTIILVRIPDNGKSAHAVSIPRDTLVAIPGEDRSDKINSVYGTRQAQAARQLRANGESDDAQIERDTAHAGRRALVSTVEQLTGVRINHYAEVNLYGFVLLTQAIGGVEVCLNAATSDPGSGANFPAGRQVLSGADALSFVRQRGGLLRGDLDRIVRQQVFMASAVNEVLSAGTLTDPGRLSALASAAQSSVVLDRGWDMLSFAQQMHGIAAGAVDFVTIPVVNPDARDDRGQSIVAIDPAQVRAFVASLVTEAGPPAPAAPVSPADPPGSVGPSPQPAALPDTVDVLNGTGIDGLASEISTRLVTAGFTAGEIGNIALRRTTMIKVAPNRGAIGEQVGALLGGGIPVLAEQDLANDQILVLVGADYPDRAAERRAEPSTPQLVGTRPQPEDARPQPESAPPVPGPPPIHADGVPCIN